MMVEVMKNRPMNDRHISVRREESITARTMPTISWLGLMTGTPMTSFLPEYTPMLSRPSYSPSSSTVRMMLRGRLSTWPTRFLSEVRSTLPCSLQMRKSTLAMREATAARLWRFSSW